MEVVNNVLVCVEESDIVNGTFIFPEGITRIEDYAFKGCNSLVSLVIPNGVTEIGNEVFSKCNSLISVEIPNSVTQIGYGAFKMCRSLKSIVIPDSVTEIKEFSFYECNSLTSIQIPDSVTKIGNEAFFNCNSLISVEIPNSVTQIGYGAFGLCKSLISIIIPDSVTKIGDSVFSGCRSLESIVFSNRITKISDYSFCGCSSLTSFVIPNGVIEIGESAFYDCSSLTSIQIPDSVTKIREYAFYFCSSLTSLAIPGSVRQIGTTAFDECTLLRKIVLPDNFNAINEINFCDFSRVNLKEIETPYGTYIFKNIINKPSINSIYFYLYANSILKEKIATITEFNEITGIYKIVRWSLIKNQNDSLKFKNLFYKLRKEYNIPLHLFECLSLEQTEKFNYSVWNKIKNTLDYENDSDMSKVMSDMINVFGLFENDKYRNNRIQYFKDLFEKRKIILNEDDYNNLDIDIKDKFIIKKKIYYSLKENIEVPEEFQLYSKNKLTEKQMKNIKKVTGTFGKRLNDFVKENYDKISVNQYQLSNEFLNDKDLKDELFKIDIPGTINKYSLHRMFDGNVKGYNEDFYKFFQDNLEEILNNEKLQSKISEISNKFGKIKNHYLFYSGITGITLKHVMDYLNSIDFNYEPGNYELNLDVKKAGVTDKECFEYYQSIYNKNDVRKLYSLVRRSNIYEINGYTIKAELLRRDDSFGMLVGEPNYTNNCQVFNGIGHNCLAHSVNSDDGGVFVTRLLKDNEWILLTESWDWQNNNVYCHDNIEATTYLKQGGKSLKKAISEVYRLDGEHIIEKSKNEVEKYIKSRKKLIDKLNESDREKELNTLRDLEQREVIKVITVGKGYDDLGLENYFSSKLQVNEDMFVNGQTYQLSNFQPVNYDDSQVYFNPEKKAYSDANEVQYIIAGSIENLAVSKLEPLIPIYRDERRIVSETGDEVRDYTVNKVKKIEKESFPDELQTYQQSGRYSLEDKNIILGEDWYLIYEEIDFDEVYIYDLAKVKPSLNDENSIQNQEMMREIYKLVDKYDVISADLKEDTSYLLYLINKKLGYFKQLGDDIAYPYGNSSNRKKITDEMQEELLKNSKKIKEQGNKNNIMHKISFKKGPKFSYKHDEEEDIKTK